MRDLTSLEVYISADKKRKKKINSSQTFIKKNLLIEEEMFFSMYEEHSYSISGEDIKDEAKRPIILNRLKLKKNNSENIMKNIKKSTGKEINFILNYKTGQYVILLNPFF